MKRFSVGLLSTLLILAALYLATVNLALNLPATRALLNGLQPDHFAVTWHRAWSLYPLRVVLLGLAGDGQTPTEQWQLDARRAAVSVSLLALLRRGEVRIHDLDLEDIDLRLRPRRRPGAEPGEVADYFPVIRNRDPDALAEPGPQETPPGTLVLALDDIHVQGDHAFWVSHIRGSLPGEVRGSVRVETGTGRLSLSGGAIDLALASLKVGPEEPLTEHAAVKGRIDIPAFSISETEGLELLRLPKVDAEIDLPVEDLDFLAWVSPLLAEFDLRGAGRLRGRILMSSGEILQGTDLVVETHDLAMHRGPLRFSGDGFIEFLVDPEDQAQADLVVRFDEVKAERQPAAEEDADLPEVLFVGHGLTAQLHAAEVDPTTTSTATTANALAAEVVLRFVMSIPSMRVDDLAVYNRLFPESWDAALLGGTGTLNGAVEVTEETLSLHFDLASDEAHLRLGSYHATTDLLQQLRAAVTSVGADPGSVKLDLAETRLQLTDAQLDDAGEVAGPPPTWSAALRVDQAGLVVPLPADRAAAGTMRGVMERLSDEGFGALLQAAEGAASAVLTVPRVDWLAALLERPMGLQLGGGGKLDVHAVLSDGLPIAGSSLRIPRQALAVSVLEHQVEGAGEASLMLAAGDTGPQARLNVAFDDARLHRLDEDEPSVGDVRLDAEVLVRDPFAEAMKDAAATAALSLAIHSARVPDLRTYNPYLPEHAGVAILGGEASLVGDLNITSDRASGELLLEAEDIRIAIAEEDLSGDLRLELLIRDGSADELRFDITGSSLVLDGFQVAGSTASTHDAHWHARLQLEDTEVLWQKPMHLDMQADVTVKDTRPFVAVLDNLRDQHGWIDALLTVEDLGGHVALTMDGDTALLREAMLSGPEIGVHVKGRSSPVGQEGMLLVRWQNLSGAMTLQGERKHFDLLNARSRFDGYTPGRTPPPFLAAGDDAAITAGGAAASATPQAPSARPQPRHTDALPGEQAPPRKPSLQSDSAHPFLDHSL
jgi:hypothetical protein